MKQKRPSNAPQIISLFVFIALTIHSFAQAADTGEMATLESTPRRNEVDAIRIVDTNNIDPATFLGKRFRYSIEKIDLHDTLCKGDTECLIVLNRYKDTSTQKMIEKSLSKIGGTRSGMKGSDTLKFSYTEEFGWDRGEFAISLSVCATHNVIQNCVAYKSKKTAIKQISREQAVQEIIFLLFADPKSIQHESEPYRRLYNSRFSKYSSNTDRQANTPIHAD